MCTPSIEQYFLTDQRGLHYIYQAIIEERESQSVTLLIQRIKSEAITQADPAILNCKPYARIVLRADGSMHAWYGDIIPLANGTDRTGYLYFSDATDVIDHARVVTWLYDLWGKLIPAALYHLPTL